MAMDLFHATTTDKARSIDQSRKMRPGRGGFAGGAIYFSASQENARRQSNRGKGTAEIIIHCRVDLGRALEADRHTVDRVSCWNMGYDSVKIRGMDIYAHYNSKKITVVQFKTVHGSQWFSSMALLEAWPPPQQLILQGGGPLAAHGAVVRNRNQPFQEQAFRHQSFPQQRGGGGECFPAHARAMMEDGSSLALAEVNIGDKVCVLFRNEIITSEVYAFSHRDPDVLAEFHVIECDTGHRLLATAAHLVPVIEKGFVPMSEIELGDILHVNGCKPYQVKSAVVTSVCKQMHLGLFAPITLEGTILVDGVSFSCYSVLRHHYVFHLAMLPWRVLHMISKRIASAAHKHGGLRLRGAHIYIDLLSLFEPLVRYFAI